MMSKCERKEGDLKNGQTSNHKDVKFYFSPSSLSHSCSATILCSVHELSALDGSNRLLHTVHDSISNRCNLPNYKDFIIYYISEHVKLLLTAKCLTWNCLKDL